MFLGIQLFNWIVSWLLHIVADTKIIFFHMYTELSAEIPNNLPMNTQFVSTDSYSHTFVY